MRHLKHIMTRPNTTGISPSSSTGNTQLSERRQFPRLEVPKGIPIEAELVTPDKILWAARCIDVSSEGTLIEFHKVSRSQVDVGDKAFLHLRLAGEAAKLPAIVKSRQENRMGLFLPTDVITQNQEKEETFFRILRTLDRAIQQRKIR